MSIEKYCDNRYVAHELVKSFSCKRHLMTLRFSIQALRIGTVGDKT